MKIKTIVSNPEQFKITKLSGGYLGKAQKVSVLESGDHYILKSMGQTGAQISHSLFLLKHIKAYGKILTNMAKVCDWEIQENGTLLALFEFIENTEDRLANISEMLQISTLSFLASKQYDYTKICKEVNFRKTVLYEIKNNGMERYSEKYFSAHVNNETKAVVDWMTAWADYFINNQEFINQYLACVGFIHRDIHRHNIIINHQKPFLIDFDFSGVDCRLIEITQPTNVYIDVDEFLPMYRKAKEINQPHFSATEKEIIDRILVLDIMANLGWEANEIYNSEGGEYQNEIIHFLQTRISILQLLLMNRHDFNLDFVS